MSPIGQKGVRRIFKIFSIFPLFLLAFPSLAAIYSFVDEHGVIHFTNIKPRGREYTVLIPEREVSDSESRVFYKRDYDTLIENYGRKYNIDPKLIKAVIIAESNFNPYAVSRRGAMGLMQLLPETARMLNVRNIFDPEENIRAGVQYLRMLKDHFRGNLDLVLAAYNAGPRRVYESKMNVPQISETLEYVRKVKELYRRLKSLNE